MVGGKKPLLPSLRKQLGALHSLKNHMSKNARLNVVNALILSRLAYSVSIWGNTTENMVLKGQRILNQAARLVTGHNKRTNQKTLMKDCNWLDMKELVKYHSCLQFWKTIKWQKPYHLWSRLQTEDNGMSSTDRPRLQIIEGAFRCKTTTTWNELPDTLKAEETVQKFKRGLKRHLRDLREDNNGPGQD